MPKQADTKSRKRAGRGRDARRTLEDLDPVLVPLLELFADVDEVFAEAGAFEPQNIHKGLGRIYRSWLSTREKIDPDFDPEKYRERMKKKPPRRTGLTVPPVSESRKRSTDRQPTSEKSRKRNAKPEKSSAKKSARRARSSGSVLHGR